MGKDLAAIVTVLYFLAACWNSNDWSNKPEVLECQSEQHCSVWPSISYGLSQQLPKLQGRGW